MQTEELEEIAASIKETSSTPEMTVSSATELSSPKPQPQCNSQ